MKANQLDVRHGHRKIVKVTRKTQNVVAHVNVNRLEHLVQLKSPRGCMWVQLTHVKKKSLADTIEVMNLRTFIKQSTSTQEQKKWWQDGEESVRQVLGRVRG
jgi:hypothetical protein